MNKMFITLIMVSSILLAGCSTGVVNKGNEIVVEKRVEEATEYKFFRKISESEKVQDVKDILAGVRWEKALVDMVRPPDYQFFFADFTQKNEPGGPIYELWISPNKDKVELVVQGESKYIQLNRDESAVLFKIITGESLRKE